VGRAGAGMGEWLVHDEIERQAHWRSDNPAFVFEGQTLTFGGFNGRVNATARALRAGGVGTGDRVAAHARNHVDLFTLFYACSKLGAVYAPVSTFQSTANVRHIADRLNPAVVAYTHDEAVVGPDGGLATIRETAPGARYLSLDDRTVGDDDALDAVVADQDRSDPAWADDHGPETAHNVFWTSGTTGRPKAAVRDHTATLGFGEGFAARLPVPELDRRLVVGNMMYLGPYLRDGITGPAAGSTLYLLREFDVATLCDRIVAWDIDALQVEFTLASELVAYLETHDVDVHVPHLYAVLESAGLAARLVDYCDHLYHLYGQTEAGHPLITELAPPFERSGPPSLGQPTPGSDIRVVDPDRERGDLPGSPPDPGTQGEMVVRSRGSMTRYLDAEKQAATVHDGWVYTGDVAAVDAAGDISFVGRTDDRIRSGGVNVYPAEVERVLDAHPGVATSVVVGAPDETWGERVCALVVADDPDLDPAALDDHCRASEGLAAELRPRAYAVVGSPEEIPTAALDKVDRAAVVERYFAESGESGDDAGGDDGDGVANG
jgi:long-chain acyl-CoA synthetase